MYIGYISVDTQQNTVFSTDTSVTAVRDSRLSRQIICGKREEAHYPILPKRQE